MRRHFSGRSLILTSLVLTALVLISPALLSPGLRLPPRLYAADRDRFKNLPAGWRVVRTFRVPEGQVAAIGRKLGGSIRELTNTYLSVHGQSLQVNILRCRTSMDAETIYRRLLQIKGSPDLCLRMDATVVELLCGDLRVARRAHYVLGFRPRSVTYRISFPIAAVEKADYMRANRLFNLFLARKKKPGDAGIASRIPRLAERFRFGNHISLRTCGVKGTMPKYSFVPKPAKKEVRAQGDVTRYVFSGLPKDTGVPFVSVVVTIRVRAFCDRTTNRKAGHELLGPTAFWPSDDPEIAALAENITGVKSRGRGGGRGSGEDRGSGARSDVTDEEQVNALLEWFLPGRNIKFGGPVTGSRYGVKATLKQGFGHCWDFSDCFVTLCRAAGIPCRQVAGWLHGRSGHVWAEVLLEGKGWRQVDPTAGMACGSDYIPYFTTEDGHMPIVYLAMPEIEVLKRK
jgi:hypothetical protein